MVTKQIFAGSKAWGNLEIVLIIGYSRTKPVYLTLPYHTNILGFVN